MLYKKRIIKLPLRRSFFLFGLRGSGKTALLKKRLPQALYIDLLEEELYQSYLSDISKFYKQIQAIKKKGIVVVDEIQRMPRLLNEVHRLIESSNHQFILTGSSARKLKAPGVNLLAGRAGVLNLYPFVPEELGRDFDLGTALKSGLLPVIWSSGSDREFSLKAYAQTYLKEEIKAEALVRNLPGFARFLEVAGFYHGQVVNMSNIARECQISRASVREFFSILEDTLLGFFLPAYTARLRLREKKHSKFYFIDPGLARQARKGMGPVSAEEKGPLFEGLVLQILRAYQSYHFWDHLLYEDGGIFYWSPAAAHQTEVDILLRKGKKFLAIEVKAKKEVFDGDYKGLKAIQELKGVKKRIIVYMGKEKAQTKDGIEIWPFEFFCKTLQTKTLW